MLTDTQREWVRTKAAAALDAAEGQRLDDASSIVRYVTHVHGFAGLVVTAMSWCDMYADHLADGHAVVADPAARVSLIDVETGRLVNDPEVMPAPVRWAGDLILAQLRGDSFRFSMLMAELMVMHEDDANERIAYLVTCVALTRANSPRGLVLMGADVPPHPNGGSGGS